MKSMKTILGKISTDRGELELEAAATGNNFNEMMGSIKFHIVSATGREEVPYVECPPSLVEQAVSKIREAITQN